MFRATHIVLMIFLSAFVQAQETGIPCRHLNVEEFYLKLHSYSNAILIDTRTFDEFKKDRIPGAILAESREKLLKLTDSLDFDQPLFLYCEFDERSYVGCDILSKLGFRYVYNLKGGLREWRLSPYELDKKKIREKRPFF